MKYIIQIQLEEEDWFLFGPLLLIAQLYFPSLSLQCLVIFSAFVSFLPSLETHSKWYNTSLLWLDVPYLFCKKTDLWFSLVDHQKSTRNPSQSIQIWRASSLASRSSGQRLFLVPERHATSDKQNSAFYLFSCWFHWCLEILFDNI